MQRILARGLLVVAVVVVVQAITAIFVPAVRMATLWAVGRSDCDFRGTLSAGEYFQTFGRHMAAVDLSERIRVDGKLQLWWTPLGEFWLDGDFGKLNRLVVIEQLMDIYGVPESFGVQSGDVVVDCGADYGMFTRRALQRGASKVFSVEIADQKKECLRRTFEREIADGRVLVSDKGVWDKAETLQLRGDTVVLDRPGAPIAVAVAPLDDLLASAGLARVDFIKFDIEGAEPQALRGAKETIRRHRPRIVIATENRADEKMQLAKVLDEILPGYVPRSVSCAMLPNGLGAQSLTTVYYPPPAK